MSHVWCLCVASVPRIDTEWNETVVWTFSTYNCGQDMGAFREHDVSGCEHWLIDWVHRMQSDVQFVWEWRWIADRWNSWLLRSKIEYKPWFWLFGHFARFNHRHHKPHTPLLSRGRLMAATARLPSNSKLILKMCLKIHSELRSDRANCRQRFRHTWGGMWTADDTVPLNTEENAHCVTIQHLCIYLANKRQVKQCENLWQEFSGTVSKWLNNSLDRRWKRCFAKFVSVFFWNQKNEETKVPPIRLAESER